MLRRGRAACPPPPPAGVDPADRLPTSHGWRETAYRDDLHRLVAPTGDKLSTHAPVICLKERASSVLVRDFRRSHAQSAGMRA